MDVQWTSVILSFATGALIGALVTYFRHWLARRREAESREFAQNQERDRIRREHCSRALAYERMRESLRGCRLSEQDLAVVCLAKAGLQRVNLSAADLSTSNLQQANLIGADLNGGSAPAKGQPGWRASTGRQLRFLHGDAQGLGKCGRQQMTSTTVIGRVNLFEAPGHCRVGYRLRGSPGVSSRSPHWVGRAPHIRCGPRHQVPQALHLPLYEGYAILAPGLAQGIGPAVSRGQPHAPARCGSTSDGSSGGDGERMNPGCP